MPNLPFFRCLHLFFEHQIEIAVVFDKLLLPRHDGRQNRQFKLASDDCRGFHGFLDQTAQPVNPGHHNLLDGVGNLDFLIFQLQQPARFFQHVGLLEIVGHLFQIKRVSLCHALEQLHQVGVQSAAEAGFGEGAQVIGLEEIQVQFAVRYLDFLQLVQSENIGFAAVVFVAAGGQKYQGVALCPADELGQKLARHIVVPVCILQFDHGGLKDGLGHKQICHSRQGILVAAARI